MSSVKTLKMPMKLSSNINNSILTRKHSNVIFEPRGGDNVENNILGEPCLPFYMGDSTKQDIDLACETSWRGYIFRREF